MSSARAGSGTSEGPAKAQSSRLKKVTFQVEADPCAAVFVAGSFNDWDPAAYKMKQNGDGFYKATVKLPVGRHEYKFVVNGAWQADPKCPSWVPNAYGSLNSVEEVT